MCKTLGIPELYNASECLGVIRVGMIGSVRVCKEL